MKRQDKETLRKDFIRIVKKEKRVFASVSHTQVYPVPIHFSAILEWQWDGELFANSATSKRITISKSMPAFHIYR